MVKKLVESKDKFEKTVLLKEIDKENNSNIHPERFSFEKNIAWRLSISQDYSKR